ncbi:MAG: 4Fe-4S dicluster domain-containing protein [Pseudomonadota bacterium]
MRVLSDMRGWVEALVLSVGAQLREGTEGRQALATWLGPQGWLALPLDVADKLAQFERCTACEACNTVCPLLASSSLVTFGGPMDLALRWGRRGQNLAPARRYLDVFSRCGACRQCEQECPQQIPLRSLAEQLRQVLDDNGVRPAWPVPSKTEGSQDPG